MFEWKKLGRILDPSEVSDKFWLKEYAQAPSTLIFDDFVRVYFSSRPHPDSGNQYVSYTGYADLDRNNLMRILRISDEPIMPLGGLGCFDEFGIYPTSVIKSEDQVWAYYGGWTRCESVPYDVAIGMAKSDDNGRTFKKIGAGPLLSADLNEPMTVSGPKIRRFGNRWFLYYVAGKKWEVANDRPESIFKIKMATSDDGISWSRENRDLIPNVLDENECQASPDVFFHDGLYHMFFSYKYGSDFRSNDRGYRIGYANSLDGIYWSRDDALAGMAASPDSGWDGQTVAYPHVFALDGEIYMMYLGNDVGKTGFGLARLVNAQVGLVQS